VPALALLLTLAAAVVHALWNQLLAHGGDEHARTAVGMFVGAAVFLPVALLDLRIDPVAWALVGPSVGLELAYFALLAAAYRRAPMGLVYPIARGSAPVFVLLASALVLTEPVSLLQVAGIALVVTGIVLVRGLTVSGRLRDVSLALAVGGCIAGYTLVDAVGVRHAAPGAYIEVVFVAVAVAYSAAVVWTAGPCALYAVLDRRTTAAGIGIVGAYGLVLLALTLAPAPPVAAVRESSVVIAMLLLAATGQEKVTPARLAGAVLVCGGIACVVA
jgi:multidrug transporter EmrE-like cation transporter